MTGGWTASGMRGGSIHHALNTRRRHLSPHPGACGTICVPLPATGRGWAHSPSSWQRPAPGRRASGSKSGRPRCNPLPAKTRSSAHAGDCPHCGLKVRWRRLRQRGRAGSQSVAPGDTNRRRGCRKATQGTRAGSQGARRGSQGGATGAFRAGWYRPQGCRRGTRVPVAPRPFCRGRTARGRGVQAHDASAQGSHRSRRHGSKQFTHPASRAAWPSAPAAS